MSFEDYMASLGERGFATDGLARIAAADAWDAALCAASGQAFEKGALRTSLQIVAGISALHSWVGEKREG